jgi:hypothetical protein
LRAIARGDLPLDGIVGRVLRAGSPEAIRYAYVWVADRYAAKVLTDSLGTFRLPPADPWPAVLHTRALGYAARDDTLHAPLSADSALQLVLEPQGFDGPCSGFAVPVEIRK